MKRRNCRGSYTIEAAIYIPLVLFLFFQSIELSLDFWMRSKEREVMQELKELDAVKEFYGYQIIEEVEKEFEDD